MYVAVCMYVWVFGVVKEAAAASASVFVCVDVCVCVHRQVEELDK